MARVIPITADTIERSPINWRRLPKEVNKGPDWRAADVLPPCLLLRGEKGKDRGNWSLSVCGSTFFAFPIPFQNQIDKNKHKIFLFFFLSFLLPPTGSYIRAPEKNIYINIDVYRNEYKIERRKLGLRKEEPFSYDTCIKRKRAIDEFLSLFLKIRTLKCTQHKSQSGLFLLLLSLVYGQL